MKRVYGPVLFPLLGFLVSSLILTSAAVAQDPPADQQPANAPAAQQQPAGEAPPQPEMPVTTRFPDDPAAEVGALLQPPDLPKKEKVTLIGGTVRKIDRIRNRVAVNIFGGKRMTFRFDERTRIFRDGTEVTSMGIQDGDRIYVDSQLNEDRRIFARNIHIVTNLVPAEASGQITSFNLRSGRMNLHDQLSSRPIAFMVTRETRITDSRGVRQADVKQLLPGALVEVAFAPAKGARGRRAIAEEIKLLATINSDHIFEGDITHLDLRSGLIAIRNERDNRTYDLALDPRTLPAAGQLRVGRKATISARYTGRDYRVRQLRVHDEVAQADSDSDEKPDENGDENDRDKKDDEKEDE